MVWWCLWQPEWFDMDHAPQASWFGESWVQLRGGFVCQANSEFCALQMALSKPSPLVSHWFGRFNNNMYWGMNRLTKWKNDIIQKLLKLWKFYQQTLRVVWIFIFVIFLYFFCRLVLSFFCHSCFCGCHSFVIFLPLGCHFFCIFLTILLSFLFHLFVIFFSFSSSSAGGWIRSRAGNSKNAISPARGSFFLSLFCHSCRFLLIRIRQAVFSSGSGKWWRWQTRSRKCKKNAKKMTPGLGKCKKDAKPKKWLPVWEMQNKCKNKKTQRKCKEHAKKKGFPCW